VENAAVAILFALIELTFLDGDHIQVCWVDIDHPSGLLRVIKLNHVGNGQVSVTNDTNQTSDGGCNLLEKYLLRFNNHVTLLS